MAPSIQRYVASVSDECDRLCPASAPHPIRLNVRCGSRLRKSGSIGRARRKDPRLHPHRKRFNDPISVDLGEVAAAAARVLGQSTQAHSAKGRAIVDRSTRIIDLTVTAHSPTALSALVPRPHHRHPNLDPHREEASPRPRRIDGAHTPVRAQQLYQKDTLKCWLSSSAPPYDDGCWPPCCYPSSLSPCPNSALSTAPKRRCTRQSVPGAVVDIEVTRHLSSGRNDDPPNPSRSSHLHRRPLESGSADRTPRWQTTVARARTASHHRQRGNRGLPSPGPRGSRDVRPLRALLSWSSCGAGRCAWGGA